MFVLIMLFLFKYIDDLIGKGFEWYVILELLCYAAATNIAMALPLSMLLSSIMTFGNLGESYELVAIKAAGVSLRKAMMPLFFLVALFAAGSFLFSDYILPVANLKMGSLLYDVRNKKADFFIKAGVFNTTIPGYAIRAKDKSEDGTVLYDLTIYDKTKGSTGSNVLMAEEGFMYNSRDQNYMILKLIDGVRYEENRSKNAVRFDPRQQFTRFYFKETEQKFSMEAFQMKRTDENLFKSHHQMLNLRQLKLKTDTNQMKIDSLARMYAQENSNYLLFNSSYYRDVNATPAQIEINGSVLDYLPETSRTSVYSNALSQLRQADDMNINRLTDFKHLSDSDIRYKIEFHPKFTLAISCLLLFGIGAPLGAIIRKGGLGAPVVMSIIFFLIYHILSTVFEKSAKDGAITPFWGMWSAIFILTPLALFLTYKSTTDSALFDLDQYKIKAQLLIDWVKDKLKLNKKAVG
jgi:lipopolysaccharide export system permease protein